MSGTSAMRTVTTGAFGVAGVAFVVYPALRPYSDEATLEGADAMASTAWVAAHTAGMVGFIALTLGVWALSRLQPADGGRAISTAAVLTWLGVSLVLPYYGAETFGLQVIAERAARDDDASLLELAESFRYGPVPLAFFGAGLLMVAAAGVLLWMGTRRSVSLLRYGGLLAGSALVIYPLQFFFPPSLRISHGAVLAIGCLLISLASWRMDHDLDLSADRAAA